MCTTKEGKKESWYDSGTVATTAERKMREKKDVQAQDVYSARCASKVVNIIRICVD